MHQTAGLRVGAAQIVTTTGVSPSDTIRRNAAAIAEVALNATTGGVDFIAFAEFALMGNYDFSSCKSLNHSDGISSYAETLPPVGSPLNCTANLPLSVIGCSEAARYATISYNTVEAVSGANGATQFFNTQVVVFNGTIVARYRKFHPFYTDCFDTPLLELVTFNVSGTTFGVFTCYDIMFNDPKQDLVAMGITHFSYSSAIPLIGTAAVQIFSSLNHVTVVSSDLSFGQSAVVVKGLTLAKAPATGNGVAVADIQ